MTNFIFLKSPENHMFWRFKGGLICLNSLNIRSQIWRQFLARLALVVILDEWMKLVHGKQQLFAGDFLTFLLLCCCKVYTFLTFFFILTLIYTLSTTVENLIFAIWFLIHWVNEFVEKNPLVIKNVSGKSRIIL